RAKGAEFALLMRPVDRFTINAAYTHVDSENRSAGLVGNDLARRPADSVSVSADYRFPFGLALGATVLTVGDSFDDAANRVRLDGYTLANLRAELPLNDRLSIYGRVENVFDADYRVVANYGTIGRAAYGGLRVKLD
ncbi:MAG: TonB-dependent receptor domain-containing protein, partial [Sphingomonas sp.]